MIIIIAFSAVPPEKTKERERLIIHMCVCVWVVQTMISFSWDARLDESRFHLAEEIIDELRHMQIERIGTLNCLQHPIMEQDRHVSSHSSIKQWRWSVNTIESGTSRQPMLWIIADCRWTHCPSTRERERDLQFVSLLHASAAVHHRSCLCNYHFRTFFACNASNNTSHLSTLTSRRHRLCKLSLLFLFIYSTDARH